MKKNCIRKPSHSHILHGFVPVSSQLGTQRANSVVVQARVTRFLMDSSYTYTCVTISIHIYSFLSLYEELHVYTYVYKYKCKYKHTHMYVYI
jgi:hypothetical protein